MTQQNEVNKFLYGLLGREQRISQLRDSQKCMRKEDVAYVMSSLHGGQDGIYFTVSGKQMFDLVDEEINQLEKSLIRDREKFLKILAIVNDELI